MAYYTIVTEDTEDTPFTKKGTITIGPSFATKEVAQTILETCLYSNLEFAVSTITTEVEPISKIINTTEEYYEALKEEQERFLKILDEKREAERTKDLIDFD